jgi:hypothetical protein
MLLGAPACAKNLIEFEIHNHMHVRWSSVSLDPRSAEPLERGSFDFDANWDDPKYDYLGDFYSSHVGTPKQITFGIKYRDIAKNSNVYADDAELNIKMPNSMVAGINQSLDFLA